MRLHQAASRFDKARCADAYDTDEVFYGQLDVFDDSKRDGVTVTRRVLSVAPGTILPARKAILLDSDYWIMGDGHGDTFLGSSIRTRYILQKAEGLLSYKTPAQVLSTGGTSAYGARLWTKDMKEIEVSSGSFSFYTLFFSTAEAVQVGNIVTVSSRLHRVKNVYKAATGMLAAEANELAAGALVASASYYARATGLNPVTDVVTEASPVTLSVIRMRFQDDYLYPNEAAPKFVEGDIKVLITKAAVTTAKVDDQIALADGRWRTIAVEDEGLCWGLHMRHG